jgi:YVTN family beta-propeller protein
VGNITVGGNPYLDNYNPDTGAVWVQTLSTSTVAVINASGSTYQAKITQSNDGTGECNDPHTHTEWLTSASSGVGTVVVVNESTFATIQTGINSGENGFQCVFDAASNSVAYASTTATAGSLYVCTDTSIACSSIGHTFYGVSLGDGYLMGVWGSSTTIATQFPDTSPYASGAATTISSTTISPMASCFDPVNHAFYSVNNGAANVTVINSTTFKPIGSVKVGTTPWACAVDAQGNVWVTNEGSANLTVISGTTKIATINGLPADPLGITYNPHTEEMYVADEGAGEVTAFGTGIQVSFSVLTQRGGIIQPGAGFTQSIYLGGSQMTGVFPSDTIFEATPNSGTTKWVAAPVYWQGYWWEPTPNNGTLTIGTSPLSVGIRYDEGSFLTVSETGLPKGVPWWMNATIPGYCQECGVKSTGGAIYQIIQDQPFNYEASSIGNWSWSLNGSNSVDIVPSNPASLVVNFVYTTNLSFSEKGLPSACGVNWGIVVNSGSQTVQQSACSGKLIAYAGNTSGLPLFTNGTTLGYSVVAPSGWTAFPSQGNVTLPDPPTIVFCQSTNSSCLSNETNATGGTGGTGGGSGGSGGGSGSSGGIGGASGVLTQPIDGVPGYGWLFLVVVAVAIVVAFISSRKGGKR